MTKPGYAGPTTPPLRSRWHEGTEQPTIDFTFTESETCTYEILENWLLESMNDGWFLAETELDGITKLRVWVVDNTDAIYFKMMWYNI